MVPTVSASRLKMWPPDCQGWKVEMLKKLRGWNVENPPKLKSLNVENENVEILADSICNYINLASTFQHFQHLNISTCQPWEKPLTMRRPGSKVPAHSKRTFSRLKSWKIANVEMLQCWNQTNTTCIKIVNISTFQGSKFQDYNIFQIFNFWTLEIFNISRFQTWSRQIKPTVVGGGGGTIDSCHRIYTILRATENHINRLIHDMDRLINGHYSVT